jgi:glycopeptide antibiotics resistance protein
VLRRLFVVAAAVPILLVVAWWSRRHGATWRETGERCLFAASLLLIVCVTLFPFPVAARWWKPWHFRHAQLVPLHTIRDQLSEGGLQAAQVFGNVLLFVPFGFALPLVWERARRAGVTIAAGALVSLAVELTQLFVPTHTTDIDDLLLNTLGAALGFAVVSVVIRARQRARTPVA